MPPLNADRFRIPRITVAERRFLDAEEAATQCALTSARCGRAPRMTDDFELPPDYAPLVDAATAWVPVTRGPGPRNGAGSGETRTAGAMISAMRRHLERAGRDPRRA